MRAHRAPIIACAVALLATVLPAAARDRVVVTNHGPRGVSDPTEYNHFSQLRTIEDALGLDGHIGHADDQTVRPMTPLFALRH
jgi:hypothetical protein